MPSCRAVAALTLIAALCCANEFPTAGGRREPSRRYLFSWCGDDDRQDSDFLAVIDHRVFSLDVRDLKNVRRVSSVSFDERQRPHWLATDGSRIVVVNEPAATAERRMWMVQVDGAGGQLRLDTEFRGGGSSRPGIAFDRVDWPHGRTGPAVPHGTVFGR